MEAGSFSVYQDGFGWLRAATPHFYGEAARGYGLSPLADQQIAGGMMFGVDVAIIFFVLTYFFFKSAADYCYCLAALCRWV